MTASTSGKTLCLNGALLWVVSAWSGFSMILEGPNKKLLLTAHENGFFHSLSLFAFGTALSLGCFPRLTSSRTKLASLLLAGGAWVALVFDTKAAFLNEAMPLRAERTGAAVDSDGLNATVLKLSAVSMGLGASLICSGMDFSLLMGRKK